MDLSLQTQLHFRLVETRSWPRRCVDDTDIVISGCLTGDELRKPADTH